MGMMTLGMFVFELKTLPFLEQSRRTNWRHAFSDRFGTRPAAQYLGPGDDVMSLAGALYGGVVGKYSSLTTLRKMADTGDAYTVIDGAGNVIGDFIISDLDERRSNFFANGAPQKIDFTLNLKRVQDPPQETDSTAASDTAVDNTIASQTSL